jgi:hypothetical protein
MLSTQDLGVKVSVGLCRDSASISLAANLDALVVCEVDVFDKGVCVERVKVQGGERGEHGGRGGRGERRRRRWHRCCVRHVFPCGAAPHAHI